MIDRRAVLDRARAALVPTSAPARAALRRAAGQRVPRPSPDGPVGAVSAPTREALQAAIDVLLVGTNVASKDYLAELEAHAASIPGYRDLFEGFTATVDAEARRSGAQDFATAEPPVQRAVLDRAVRARVGGVSSLRMFRVLLRDRKWTAVDRFIVQPVLLRFALTDAWLLAGYPDHPGRPRSLEDYQQPVSTEGAP